MTKRVRLDAMLAALAFSGVTKLWPIYVLAALSALGVVRFRLHGQPAGGTMLEVEIPHPKMGEEEEFSS